MNAAGRLQVGIRPLADEVDHRTRITGRRKKSWRAPDDLDSVIDGSIKRAGLDAERKGQGYAIDLERLNVEPARRLVDAISLSREHAYPRHSRKERIHIIQLKVVDLLPGHDTH